MYAGKFARICQTTKDTLRHYDEINLLKPASISESGYKIYSASQVVDFLVISSLKDAGCTLDEIRAFQEHHDRETTLELFDKKKSEIEEEAKKIERRRFLVESAIASLQTQEQWLSSRSSDSPCWRLAEVEESYFLSTRMPLRSENPEDLFLEIAKHEKSRRENTGIGEAPFSSLYLIGEAAFSKGGYEDDFRICAEIPKEEAGLGECSRRPAGLHLQTMHRLPFSKTDDPAFQEDNPLFDLLGNLRKQLEEKALEACGDVLIREISSCASPESNEVQIVIDIPVEGLDGRLHDRRVESA